ncbi:1-acyl-sn-glycerol-3-phosphate acyltransferase [Kribbella sandramycini]|uniref:1-acyl-sn-glycerol-3-phosphate acyltransferase n=1 Tax=Kribbella sandramycini TaxID=60450 RepID=A0A7Y4P1G4_9ACTN|nr:lysophospholipid acyltransferase family protein [Kribbella sandramycini]MBB6566408.1 1-acyl-sn-glycerol-3-phosphate acyltransferase [Kribbella sandramycini]NOL42933.1 1-acyl-sn-glycerol-3-phosphate acyltransferase [Kribbella sandramycini]
MRDFVYPPVVGLCRTAFKVLDVRFQLTGTANVPRTGGALIALNHISYVDFVLGGYGALPSGRLVRFMAKEVLFRNRFSGPLMRGMHHIPVDRSAGAASYQQALDFLRAGEVVGVFPEATISRSFELKEFKSGTVRLAAEAGVPVIPMILWGTQRFLTKDHPKDFARHRPISITVGAPITVTPDDDPGAATDALRATMAGMLDETIRAYPEQPAGAWWLPAAYGGSAPTPAEADRIDREELERRAAKKAQSQE